MNAQLLFAVLVGLQAAHSLEETVFGLYDLLPYINWIDGLRPGGAFVFFVVGNTLFVLFGIWCYVARVRPKAPNAGFFVMLWVILETMNGSPISWATVYLGPAEVAAVALGNSRPDAGVIWKW